jgi:hypothetical protein
MADYTLSNILIGIVLIGCFISVSVIVTSALVSQYSPSTNSSQLQRLASVANFSQSQVTNLTEDVKQNSSTIQEKTGALDIIGSIFSQSYKSLVVVYQSLGATSAMVSEAGLSIGSYLGVTSGVIFGTISAIIMIIIVIGVMLAILVKWRT